MSHRYRVLFVCIGNACRSQMAEAFARERAADVIEPASCGTHYVQMVAPVTQELMREIGIDLSACAPKGFLHVGTEWDLIVNMSGAPLPVRIPAPVVRWDVEDPYWLDPDRHREIRDEIQGRVNALAEELRQTRAVKQNRT